MFNSYVKLPEAICCIDVSSHLQIMSMATWQHTQHVSSLKPMDEHQANHVASPQLFKERRFPHPGAKFIKSLMGEMMFAKMFTNKLDNANKMAARTLITGCQ